MNFLGRKGNLRKESDPSSTNKNLMNYIRKRCINEKSFEGLKATDLGFEIHFMQLCKYS